METKAARYQRPPTVQATRARKKLVDMAWAFDRRIREDNELEGKSALDRMVEAAGLIKKASECEIGEIPMAHRMLAQAIRDDINNCGFTDSGAVELLYQVYNFLDEFMGMNYVAGTWTDTGRLTLSEEWTALHGASQARP